METHVVQSPEWGEFKTAYGTPAIRVGEVQFTKHAVPGSPFFYAYCPKVNPSKIDFDALEKSLKDNNCIAINFDVPNVLKGSEDTAKASEIFEIHCRKAFKNTFAKHNILLDISKNEDELIKNMHSKHRYNIRYAAKHGVTVKTSENQSDQEKKDHFETFYILLKNTAQNQKYFIHTKEYYKKLWEMLNPKNIAHLVTAEFEGSPLASWMLFTYSNVLYYPYGGSTEEHKNLFASNLVGWEAIRLGKRWGCHTFDMWGACKNLADKSDPWWGFSNFKIKYGGKHVEYMDSYDFVVNKRMYYLFNVANQLRWELLKLRQFLP